MPQPLRLLIALAGAALLSGAGARGQVAGAPPAPGPVAGALTRLGASGDLTVQHSFPLAGGRLVVVFGGLLPGEHLFLQLLDAASAAPSVREYVADPASPQRFQGEVATGAMGELGTIWFADEHGLVVLAIDLDDPLDADRPVDLQAVRVPSVRARVLSVLLSLRVQPPLLVVPGPSGLQRISLLSGEVLQPPIAGDGGLRGLALSETGALLYVLRDGGRLEVLPAHQGDAPPLSVRALDAAADLLAGGAGLGAAFAVARPAGEPFPPAASLLFLDEGREPLVLESMGQPVTGRRVAVSDDGMTAFLAEDDLIVREVDLATGRVRGLITAGLAGDGAISDVLMAERRLFVTTRGPLGRRGALTVFGLDTGVLATFPLDVDPLRLVAIDGGAVLVVPASAGAVAVVESGVPTRRVAAPDVAAWLDAVPATGGALLLASAADGSRSLHRFDALTGAVTRLLAAPAATRLAGAGGDGPAVLLGDPSGAVHVFDPVRGALWTPPDVASSPSAAFFVLP